MKEKLLHVLEFAMVILPALSSWTGQVCESWVSLPAMVEELQHSLMN